VLGGLPEKAILGAPQTHGRCYFSSRARAFESLSPSLLRNLRDSAFFTAHFPPVSSVTWTKALSSMLLHAVLPRRESFFSLFILKMYHDFLPIDSVSFSTSDRVYFSFESESSLIRQTTDERSVSVMGECDL
jgi:hypothetical protein